MAEGGDVLVQYEYNQRSMSEESAGQEIRLKSLSIILNNSVGRNPQKLKSLSVVLREENIIKSTDERKNIVQLAVNDGKIEEAIQQMITKVSASEHGIQYFVTALKDEELDVDRRFSEILSVILDDKNPNETKLKLISLWGELVSFQQDVKPVIEQLWPDNTTLTEDQWPLGFIHFCVTSPDDNVRKVEDFVSSATFLSPQVKETETTGGTDEANNFIEQNIEDGGPPSDDDSFVILEKDDEGGVADGSLPPTSFDGARQLDEGLNEKPVEKNGPTSPVDPMLTSTESQASVNMQLEDALNQTADSPHTSIVKDTPPEIYKSQESSLAVSEPSSSPSTGACETQNPTTIRSTAGTDDANRDDRSFGPPTRTNAEQEPDEIFDPSISSKSGSEREIGEGPRNGTVEQATAGTTASQDGTADANREYGSPGLPSGINADLEPDEIPDPSISSESNRDSECKNDEERGPGPEGQANTATDTTAHQGGPIPTPRTKITVQESLGSPPPYSSDYSDAEAESNDEYSVSEEDDIDEDGEEVTEDFTGSSGNRDDSIDPNRAVPAPAISEDQTISRDRELAFRMNCDAALHRSRLETTASSNVPQGSRGILTRILPQAKVEFRVVFSRGQKKIEKGWTPVLRHKSKYYTMNQSRSGYFYAEFWIIKGTKFKYRYLLQNGKEQIKSEYLPKGNASMRVRDIKSDAPANFAIHDVAYVKKGVETCSQNQWETFAQYDMKWLLTPPKDIVAAGSTSFAATQEVWFWLCNMKAGWRVNPGKYHYKCTQESIEKALEEWLASSQEGPENKEEAYKALICSRAVIEAIYKCKFSIGNQKLLSRICRGLHIHGLNRESQSEVFRNVTQTGIYDKELVRNSLQDIFKQIIACETFTEPACILAIPFYWLVCNDGSAQSRCDGDFENLLESRAILPITGNSSWLTLRGRIWKHPNGIGALRDLSEEVKWVIAVHAWFINTYQYFLTPDLLIEVITKTSLTEKFLVDSVFSHVLPQLDPVKFSNNPKRIHENRKKAAELSGFFSSMFNELRNRDEIQRLEPTEREVKSKSALHILELLQKALRSTVDAKAFDSSERACILWLITMACNTANWFHALNTNKSALVGQANAAKYSILAVLFVRITELKEFQNRVDAPEVEFYNSLFKKKWDDADFQEAWVGQLKNTIARVVDEEWHLSESSGMNFFTFYLITLKDVNLVAELDAVMQTKAYELAGDAFAHTDTDFSSDANWLCIFVRDPSDRSVKVFATAFAKDFEKYYSGKKASSDEFRFHVLKFLVESPFAIRFYRAFVQESIEQRFSGGDYGSVMQVHKVAQDLVHDIPQKNATVEELELLLNNRQQVIEVLALVRRQKAGNKSPIAKQSSGDKEFELLLKNFETELRLYKQEMDAVEYFLNLCGSLRPKIQVKCDKLEKIHNRKNSTLLIKNLHTSFIGKDELDEILRIATLKESQIFFPKIKDVGNRFYSQALPSQLHNGILETEWTEVLTTIVMTASKELLQFLTEVDQASLSPESLTTAFKFTDGVEKMLKKEMLILYKFSAAAMEKAGDAKQLEKDAAKKAMQLANVFKIQQSIETLEWFHTFQKKHNLSGDFEVVERFQKSFDGLGEKQFDKLRGILDISREQLNVLQAFTKEEALIQWLQTKMKDESEVRGLCLVAVESTRHDPAVADKWSFLSDAVAAFEALIFNLDKVSSLKRLLTRTKNVLRKVEADKDVLDKWSDASKKLDWYKEHEQWYGSEEKTALHYAEKVNMQGIYAVGKLKATELHAATLENSMKLGFSGRKSGREDKSGTENGSEDTTKVSDVFSKDVDINYLHEIESKLMLIANDNDEGKTEINQFVTVLNAIESLTDAYVDLVNAGFMLLNDWTAIISSSKSKDTNMMTEHILTLKITFKKGIPPLMHTVSIQDVNLLSGILRDALARWNKHVSSMQMKHYFLNEYNIQQIKFLCSQLGKVRQSSLDDQAYLLLSDLPRSNMTTIIRESLSEAMTIDDQEEPIQEQGTPENEQYVTEEVAEMRSKRRAVRQLVNGENTSEALAKAAVQAEGYNDLTNCSNWILIHEYDTDLVLQLSRHFDQSAGFVYEQADIQEDVSILQNRSAKTLEGMISVLQEKASEMRKDVLQAVKTIFVGYLNNTTELTLSDCLSLNHLGRFLTILHKKMEREVPSPTRQLPKSFQKRVPNFILTEKHDTIPLVLSLYANSTVAEGLSPLPIPTEVLLCSENTAADEVERFMRQAMCKHPHEGKLLFCLTSAEKLNFNVSKALERIFDKLSRDEQVSSDYQLVIISSDRHHYVANCFDKYKVEKFPDFDETSVQCYVKQHMTITNVLRQEKVKVVYSERSGVGKSLYVKRVIQSLQKDCQTTTVRLLEKNIELDSVVERLLRHQESTENPQLVHIDLTPAVENGVEKFIFDLVILGLIKDSSWKVWRKHKDHSYIIEVTKQPGTLRPLSHTLDLLPTKQCLAPLGVLKRIRSDEESEAVILMDEQEFKSDLFQRPYQYLRRYENNENLGEYDFEQAKTDGINRQSSEADCIDVLHRHCGISDPSWAQLKHFVNFLNVQLTNCEKSAFCLMLDNELKGLKELAVKFMIRMAQDFATPSLVISDESGGIQSDAYARRRDVLQQHQIRRKWEENEHPYVFFNDDKVSMSFINVNIDRKGNLRDREDNLVVKAITSPQLVTGLRAQGIQLGHNFHTLKREVMIEKLCRIMGIDEPHDHDPDPTYQLTTDNVLKMIAIYMRFRCNIPVIIMGETGCGKTRMVEFMSRLQAGKDDPREGMKTLKIHGGIGVNDIFESVRNSASNKAKRQVIFYDEANTTTAIYAIKEVMCDLTVDGEPFRSDETNENANTFDLPKLQLVAACNPYKQLSKEALAKLESSGLGYRVATDKTSDRLGKVAMRTLVYRVVALPPSIQPFVWDFGQLSDETEQIYINKMVASKLQKGIGLSSENCQVIVSILCAAQTYMKDQKNECRYVSLRDVERTIELFKWFHRHKSHLFRKMDSDILRKNQENNREPHPEINESLRCLLQAIGISYYVSLENRRGFRDEISRSLVQYGIVISQYQLEQEYTMCQTAFHRDLKSGDNIAWNEALRENVFLIAICTDVKLPLYLIGKPGSSKSLAKAIVEANMKGPSSNSPFFKKLKKVEVLSYQCSALTQASGIKKIFKDAASRQQDKDLSKFTALVVLDEIGLAEDSPNMPLKILHPLLECGNADSGTLTQYEDTEKVAFVGISNWALDPAKMNRGIFVTRSTPRENDLFQTAQGIFQGNVGMVNKNYTLLQDVTRTYLSIYKKQGDQYFGLRDYYCLIKMIRSKCKKNQPIGKEDIAYVLVRNFSGGKERHVRALLESVMENLDIQERLMSRMTLREIVSDNIEIMDNRFLLLLTTQHSSLSLLRYVIPDFDKKVQVIFGSSFPGDHTYAKICRNINRIKICMELGQVVVLLNMTEIHESLYDVLNQHYVRFGGQRYVAIGLGSHRVWSRVHEHFRIIVMEKNETVQDYYPIPLINRLEKHHLLSKSLLSEKLLTIAKQLENWAKKFSEVDSFSMSSTFIGFHNDTTSSIVLAREDENIDRHKSVMLQVATPDSLYRLSKSKVSENKEKFLQIYMEDQIHDCLFNLLRAAKSRLCEKSEIFEVVSFSNILTEEDRRDIELKLNLLQNSVMLISLQQFKVEQEYSNKLDDFLQRCVETPKEQRDKEKSQNVAILLIQTAQAHANGKLIECAKHNFMNKLREFSFEKMNAQKMIVAFILSTHRHVQANGETSEFTIHTSRDCKAVYVDELRHSESNTSTTLISSFYKKGVADILEDGATLLVENSTPSHVLCILQDCISEAMSKVTSSESFSDRQIQRIRTLQKICGSTGSALEDVGHGFLKILFNKMMTLSQSESSKHDNLGWITEEACSQEKLQEGGTFGKTMHLCLKRRLADMLAFIVSVIDENNNISILLSQEKGMEWKFDLWLQLFNIMHLKKPGREQVEYTVQTVQHLDMDHNCNFPFSFVISKKLLRCFDAAEKVEKKEDFFYNAIKNEHEKEIALVLGTWNPSNCMKMMESYAYDLLKFELKAGANNEKELDAMVKILFEYSKKMWMAKGRISNGVAVTFFTFKEIIDHLSTLSSVFRICPDLMKKVNNWVTKQQEAAEFHIHEYALDDLLDWVYEKAGKIEGDKTCIEWMHLSSQMKEIFENLFNTVISDERKSELQEKRKPLALLDMLLTHLLPWDNDDPDYSKYAGLVVVQAKRLFKAMERMGFHSKDVMKIVTTIIRKSYEDLELSLIMQWRKPNCVCGRRIQSPIQMPCKCFVCNTCSAMISESRICPRCTQPWPEAFQSTRATPSSTDRQRLVSFQTSCTGFFLEYLHEFCFRTPFDRDNMEDKEKVRALFDDAFLSEKLHNPLTENQFKIETTKLDLNVAVKGNIFLLLLKLHPSFVEEKMNTILTGTFKDDNLFMATLKGFENACADVASEQDVSNHSEDLLRESWNYLIDTRTRLLTFEGLQHVGRIRYALNNLVKCLEHRRLTLPRNEMASRLFLAAKDICTLPNSDVIQKFIAKAGKEYYGREWLRQIHEVEHFKAFLSGDFIKLLDKDIPDHWEILGEDYKSAAALCQSPKRAKDVFNLLFPPNTECLSLQNLPKIMAVIRSKTSAMMKILKSRIGTKEGKFLINSDQLFKQLSSEPGLSKRQAQIVLELVVLAVGAVLCKMPMMKEMYEIITDPESTAQMFWPAMPESNYDQVNEAMHGEAAYSCPNGHVYYIGDCTFPWTMSHCPEAGCGAVIGGFFHMTATGNQRMETSEESELGYQLYGIKMGMDNPVDRTTEQAAAVMQFFVHSSMIMALPGQKEHILNMIRKENEKEGFAFLANKLQENLSELSNGLGCSVDDAVLVLHQILSRMTTLDFQNEDVEIIPDWANKNTRRAWEKDFRRRYLLPIFQEADTFIIAAKQRLQQPDSLARTLHEDATLENCGERLTCFHPILWKFMKDPTASHLLHSIADSTLAGRVLRTILQTRNLHLVKHLDTTLKLQGMLIRRYQNKCDMKDLENISFSEIRKGERLEMVELIDNYIKLWNMVLPMFPPKHRSDRIMAQYMRKIDISSPITMALPSARGRGRCAKLLVEYLIDIQNDFLQNCKMADKSMHGITEVEVTALHPSHCVCVNKQKDLLPMIHLHTAYSIITDDHGRQHHRISYNIATLERQAKERHALYKKMINKKSLPCIKYAQDVGVGTDWEKVQSNVKQIPLPVPIEQEIEDRVRTVTLADICEGVRTLTQAISFLARVKIWEEEANKRLRDYLENDLMLSASHLAMIPMSATIRHTLALYQKLSYHKAVRFVQQGLDPYKECLQDVEQVDISDPELVRRLKEAFLHMDLNSLQQHLNEILIQVPDFNPRWRLLDIFPELSFIEENPSDSWYRALPEEVFFEHVSHLFRLSVKALSGNQE